MRLEFSAGGIVFQNHNNQTLILVCRHSLNNSWVFPKGLIGDHVANESKESTAVREVEEETGAKAKIIKPLSPITYWFVWKGEKVKKTVYYFLMRYLEGDIAKHDHEMNAVEWLPMDKITDRLTYQADKKTYLEAVKYLEDLKK